MPEVIPFLDLEIYTKMTRSLNFSAKRPFLGRKITGVVHFGRKKRAKRLPFGIGLFLKIPGWEYL